ncbi:MAG: hypothetical protein NT027_10235 [Proteobacteria bacterium]|nr:hypothetical protein [Pseudomonadota bacterium]
MAQGRRDKYLNASKEAAKALEDAQAQFNEIKKKFDAIDSELKSFKQQSEAVAKDEAAKIIAEGERLGHQISLEAKRIAEEEIARAKFEMRQEIVKAALKSAENKIETSLGDADKAKLMTRRIGDLRAYHV